MLPRIWIKVSVAALFICDGDVLLFHRTTPPEADCWDLPGGWLDPGETLEGGIAREVWAKLGVTTFEMGQLLTVAEAFYEQKDGWTLHKIDIIYQCRVDPKPTAFRPLHEDEIGPQGIHWRAIAQTTPQSCSSLVW